jgi:hypothetical protein
MRPDDVGLGGFDSHTLPPAGDARSSARSSARWGARLGALYIAVCVASTASAQLPTKPDSTPGFKATATDTVGPQKRVLKPFIAPPITPRRAFLYSAIVPGMGQAALDRKYTGAVFFLIEAMSWALLRRSADDERIAKTFLGDSVPLTYTTDPTTGLATRDANGRLVVSTWAQTAYTPQLVRARALHVEDWVAVILFNHLFSGADAFVAANLWDLPQHLGMRVTPLARGGAAMTFSISVR